MSEHSVRRHLRIEIDAYDKAIRCFIPGYDAMLEVAARTFREIGAGTVLDLGAGTGALSEAILSHAGPSMVELVDVDPEMLAQASTRLAGFKERVRVREASFLDPLPSCDGVAASLALHHVHVLEDKRALFGRIHDALRPGGVFVNADATMPADPEEQRGVYDAWADFMESRGIERAQAFRHFEEWADEDTYFPLEEEMAAMDAVGLDAECVWREGPIAVVVARKPAPAHAGRSGR